MPVTGAVARSNVAVIWLNVSIETLVALNTGPPPGEISSTVVPVLKPAPRA